MDRITNHNTDITEKTAAAAYFISHIGRFRLPLAEAIRIAHAHNMTVIVDAASELPPVSHLRAFLEEGADLVIFSGGKGIAGPRAAGRILGRPEMIARCALNAFRTRMPSAAR
ncbi:MAG TPA: aminotransferase class V-fold PLP-dependent enzyme [Acetobacteraceae bacterium]|nr:aminotransferase class V-fold PLP-dependent enzyme [Acetobacteraceae bacterium]